MTRHGETVGLGPISPELALVDPELAELARRLLPDPSDRQAQPRAAAPRVAPVAATSPVWRPPPERRGGPHRRRWSVALGAVSGLATAIPSLLLGAVIGGMVASEVRAHLVDAPAPLASSSPERPAANKSAAKVPPTVTAPLPDARAAVAPRRRAKPQPASRPPKKAPARRVTPAALAQPAIPPPATAPRANPKRPTVTRSAARWIPSKAEVEARTLLLLQQRVALWVPPELIDKRTNLLVNNVNAVCRQIGKTPRFDCTLAAASSSGRGWPATVVAARDGSVKLTWRGRTARG